MAIDPELLELLACPSDDHAPLAERDGALVCTYCATTFRIDEHDIAVLLLDEATPGPNGIGAASP